MTLQSFSLSSEPNLWAAVARGYGQLPTRRQLFGDTTRGVFIQCHDPILAGLIMGFTGCGEEKN